MSSQACRDLLLHVIADAADNGDFRPLVGATPVQVGEMVPTAVPLRVTVSLDSLTTLARLAGFADLAEAFAEVDPDGPAMRH